MKKLSVITKSLMIAAASMVGSAYAQGPLLNDWTGFYAGANAGVIFNNVELKSEQLGFTNPDDRCDTNSDFVSFFPGVQFGYMYQYPNDLVSGIEANITVNTNQKKTLNCDCVNNDNVYDRFAFKNRMQGSIKGLLGRAVNWNNRIFLPYVTAGISFADLELTYSNEGGDHYSNSDTQPGLLVGAGIEWPFMPNISLRLEYSYMYYGNAVDLKIPSVYGLDDPNGNGHADLSTNNIAAAINYWF